MSGARRKAYQCAAVVRCNESRDEEQIRTGMPPALLIGSFPARFASQSLGDRFSTFQPSPAGRP